MSYYVIDSTSKCSCVLQCDRNDGSDSEKTCSRDLSFQIMKEGCIIWSCLPHKVIDNACACDNIIAEFNLLCDDAAYNMSDHAMYDYVNLSDSGCQNESDLFEAYRQLLDLLDIHA